MSISNKLHSNLARNKHTCTYTHTQLNTETEHLKQDLIIHNSRENSQTFSVHSPCSRPSTVALILSESTSTSMGSVLRASLASSFVLLSLVALNSMVCLRSTKNMQATELSNLQLPLLLMPKAKFKGLSVYNFIFIGYTSSCNSQIVPHTGHILQISRNLENFFIFFFHILMFFFIFQMEIKENFGRSELQTCISNHYSLTTLLY